MVFSSAKMFQGMNPSSFFSPVLSSLWELRINMK